ncbi:hypothetical protein C0Q70_08567 [Pomacea canaliculata]|uniref:Uncharacterized protein n=1 Tax=Pomacea canaliculata TaxID=400727 RepID=A0A2T7PI66_POMCA|nr:hypothetical protein C0Q70_08567 [Pomacea canaliculata]
MSLHPGVEVLLICHSMRCGGVVDMSLHPGVEVLLICRYIYPPPQEYSVPRASEAECCEES